MANFVYSPYRNAVVGKSSDYAYSTVLTNFATTIFALMNDDGTVAPAATDVFQSVYATSENPVFAKRTYLASVTSGTVATGVVDAADYAFSTAADTVLTGSTSVESLIISKFITSAAASPLLARFDTATGLPLTPNGADVTVVWNASGIWKF
jgi:hypothetical protein